MLSNTRKKIALLQMRLFISTTLQNGLCLKKNYSIWQNSIEKGREKKRGGNLEFWEKMSFKFLL